MKTPTSRLPGRVPALKQWQHLTLARPANRDFSSWCYEHQGKRSDDGERNDERTEGTPRKNKQQVTSCPQPWCWSSQSKCWAAVRPSSYCAGSQGSTCTQEPQQSSKPTADPFCKPRWLWGAPSFPTKPLPVCPHAPAMTDISLLSAAFSGSSTTAKLQKQLKCLSINGR